MKTAAEAVQNLAPGRTVLRVPMKCPECDQNFETGMDCDVLKEFPLLQNLSWIIVCNDCADFRHAYRDAFDAIVRMSNWYRAKVSTLLSKRLDPTAEDQKLGELRKIMDSELSKRLRRFTRIIGRKVRKEGIPFDALKQRLLSVLDETKTYDGEVERRISTQDETPVKLSAFAASFGVSRLNHWKQMGLP